jgi:hypothetical protein
MDFLEREQSQARLVKVPFPSRPRDPLCLAILNVTFCPGGHHHRDACLLSRDLLASGGI